jgi:GAF domain-containing protein
MPEYASSKKNTPDEENIQSGENLAMSGHGDMLQMIEDFIKNNKFQGKSITRYSSKCLSLLAKYMEISQGAFFMIEEDEGKTLIRFVSGYAITRQEETRDILEPGEGFPGQVAKDGKLINISDIPEGYLTIESGLGKASPSSLIIFPVKHDNKLLAVIELASFHKFTEEDEYFFMQISPNIAQQILSCETSNNKQ